MTIETTFSNAISNGPDKCDGKTWDIFRDGVRVGMIESIMGNFGSIMFPKWLVERYEVSFFESDVTVEFKPEYHGGARRALSAAKVWARENE